MSFKVNIGEMTEDEVQRSVEGAFSPFFVFRAPRKDEDQKEVTDVLVPWDNVALIIQVKAQALSASGEEPGEPLKWAEKNLAKAGRQVAGAARAIRGGRLTYMENPLRGRVPFPAQEIEWIYGVIVLHHVSPAYEPFELVPALQKTAEKNRIPLHVLSFRDFYNLSYFLDTPGDLVNYLEERSSVLVPTLKPKVHEEGGLFDYWLENLESIMAFRAKKEGKPFTAEDARPYAEEMRRLMNGQMPEEDAGAVIDHMIERAHEQDPSLGPIRRGEEILEMGPAASVKVATELSKITRVRRIHLGRRYLRTLQRAGQEQRDAWKTTHSPRRSDCTLFLASPLPVDQRSKRQERLHWMTELLKHRHQVKKGLGIATEAGENAGRSYDYVYIEGDPVENQEASLAAQELFGGTAGSLRDEPT